MSKGVNGTLLERPTRASRATLPINHLHLWTFTPLKIYNETPEWRLNRDLRATLPINELKGKPPTEVCPILHP